MYRCDCLCLLLLFVVSTHYMCAVVTSYLPDCRKISRLERIWRHCAARIVFSPIYITNTAPSNDPNTPAPLLPLPSLFSILANTNKYLQTHYHTFVCLLQSHRVDYRNSAEWNSNTYYPWNRMGRFFKMVILSVNTRWWTR